MAAEVCSAQDLRRPAVSEAWSEASSDPGLCRIPPPIFVRTQTNLCKYGATYFGIDAIIDATRDPGIKRSLVPVNLYYSDSRRLPGSP